MKEEKVKDRALMNTIFDMKGTGRLTCELNGLSAICKGKIEANAMEYFGCQRM